ncbi:dihydrodipicolinate reductase [Leucobacter denitrificans]|uniref:Dihydrodipicolinate reductase n=2 Tax=Leucobacter denitrificans TaxID=683042 RepID=A0A7G9S7S1_9MICO|nr:dihydrodipicolinate reductase [Leucobacter denitrificans]
MYGVGAMGSIIARMLTERGAEIVGAVGRSTIGKPLSEVTGIPNVTVTIEGDIEEVVQRTRPDLVVMTTASYMEDVKEGVLACLKHGANVISLAEENLYSWHTSPEDTAEIDAVAKEHGVTYTCSGHQDGYWVQLVATLMGTAHHIDEVRGRASWNVEDFGPELARDQQVGDTLEEFAEWLRGAERPPTFGRPTLHAVAAASGLTVVESSTATEPVLATEDTYCKALEMTVPAGKVLGFTDIDTVRTAEGPVLVLEMTGKVYVEGQADSNAWELKGEPDLDLENQVLPTHLTTCATLVNRVPQVLNAEPGYVSVAELPPLRFQPGNIADHLTAR